MTALLETYVPTLAQLGGLGAVLVVAFGFTVVGAIVAGPRRLPEGDLLYGWAAVAALFTLIGVAGPVPFTWIAWLAAAIALVSAAVLALRERRLGDRAALRIVVLALPLLVLVAAMTPSQWDEFTQWLPNARYLVENDGFPRAGLPRSPSVFPAYPYGLPLVIYLVSRITGTLIENAGALFNVLLLLAFALVIARLVRMALSRPDPGARVPMGLSAPVAGSSGWAYCALGALAVTVLNPAFVPRIVFTAYADTATAVALGFSAVAAWLMLNALAEDDGAGARALAWQWGLAASALVLVKQVNLVLFAAVLAAAVLVALRDPRLRLRPLLRLAPHILVLPLVLYVAWRVHVAFNIEGGEFSLRPPAQWDLALIPDILARMALIATKKGGYFAVMLIACGFALRGLRRMNSDFDRLAVIAATVFVLYNAFLLFAYVAAFGEYDARRAASFWRYNTHLGLVAVAFAAYGLALAWRRYVTPRGHLPIGWIGIVLILVLPAAFASKIRFDARAPYVYVRGVAADLARTLAPGDRLLVIDADDNGQYAVIVRYAMHGSARIVGEITAYDRPLGVAVAGMIARTRPSHVWVRAPLPAVTAALATPLAPGASYLLVRRDDGWAVARSWPYDRRADLPR